MCKDAAFQIFTKRLEYIGLGGGGRPGHRTDLHWPTQTRSRGARRWFGTEESARDGAGCRAWASHQLARPRVNASVNALALGVQWRAWGSASVDRVPDDTRFISSFVHLRGFVAQFARQEQRRAQRQKQSWRLSVQPQSVGHRVSWQVPSGLGRRLSSPVNRSGCPCSWAC